MASTISTINKAKIDEKVQSALRYLLPLFSAFSFRVNFDANKVVNDVVYVPLATDPTVGTKTAGTIVSGTGALAGTAVTLNTFEGAGWDAKESEIPSGLFADYWADKAAGGVYGLAKQIIDAALALVTPGNYDDAAGTDKQVVALADYGQQDLADLWAIAESKIKERQRTFGMGPNLAARIMGDSNIGNIFSNTGVNFLSTGVVPQLLGMPSWCYGAFPSSNNLTGAVFGRSAIALAVAPVDELMGAGDGDIMERYTITEPSSGITVLYTMTGNGGGIVKGEVAALYGVAKGVNSVVRVCKA